ncbi:hypothetical protein Taro_022102 [Colocasia esculenta]|uniref:Uncharacterized protein n=1 Tax=Colocasia esculenta TaxID=4460 RepID=A0A843V7G7_COLES|nr:hypothetical protein [Colocasia esculenta]
MLQQGSANSFELAVCRLSSLLIHQLSRTLPTQQSADSATWPTQQPGRLSSLPTHVAVRFCQLMQQRDFGPGPDLYFRLTKSNSAHNRPKALRLSEADHLLSPR